MSRRILLAGLGLSGLLACLGSPFDPRRTQSATESDGAVVPPGVPVVGRTLVGAGVALLTGDARLLHVEPLTGDVQRVDLGWTNDDPLVGLGWHEDLLWTLRGASRLTAIDASGAAVREEDLGRTCVTVFGWTGRLIVESLDLHHPAPLLYRRDPGGGEWQAFGSLAVPEADAGVPQRLGLYLAVCGLSTGARLPCWLWSETTVELVDAAGTSLVVPMTGVRPLEVPDAANRASRPIRDAFVDEEDRLWTLVSRQSSGSAGEVALQIYGPSGQLMRERILGDPARLILWAQAGLGVLLGEDGRLQRLEIE